MIKMKIILVLLLFIAISARASEHSSAGAFIPKNNLKIPVSASVRGGIDQAGFDEIIDRVVSFYAPIAKARGGVLKINHLWDDETVNSDAEREGKSWIINAYGGLARHPVITKDGFSLVLCHEMGHHLGGYPKFADAEENEWASNEGQADYFATMKCFRRVHESDDNASIVSSLEVPKIVNTKCSDTFKTTDQMNLCVRDAMAGNNLARLLWAISNDIRHQVRSEPSFDTPDPSVVDVTDDSHPEPQCRMDTYFNGSICGADFNEDFGQKDPSTGACSVEKHDTLGYRPLCWYKPLGEESSR